jgi:hypothetical protein
VFRQPHTDGDAAARFLSGLPGKPGSPYLALESDPAWSEHVRKFQSAWSYFEKVRKPGMDAFATTELEPLGLSEAVVLYPFSGADVLTPILLFPGCREFALIALEPPGAMPSPHDFQTEGLTDKLEAFRKTLQSLLSVSFFITSEMDEQLRGQVVAGVLPDLLVELVRTGHTIDRYAFVSLSPEGRLTPRELGSIQGVFGHNQGVVIDFHRDTDKLTRRLAYVSANLNDYRAKGNAPFRAWLARQTPANTLLKSTSYLIHKPHYSIVRDAVLSQSRIVVQDDSGVPFSRFDPHDWDVRLYGSYEKPIRRFAGFLQEDLKAAFEEPDRTKPLDFGFGYGVRKSQSSVILAIRKK